MVTFKLVHIPSGRDCLDAGGEVLTFNHKSEAQTEIDNSGCASNYKIVEIVSTSEGLCEYAVNGQGGIYCLFTIGRVTFIELGSPMYGYKVREGAVLTQNYLPNFQSIYENATNITNGAGYNVCIKIVSSH